MKKTMPLLALILIFFGNCISAGKQYGNFNYEISEKGAIITHYEASERDIFIPEKINGYNVVGIKSLSFYENARPNIQSITIPSTIEWINPNAFNYCTNLHEIRILGDAEKISGMDALYNSPELRNTRFVYIIPRTTENILFQRGDSRISLITKFSIFGGGRIIKADNYSVNYNNISIMNSESYKPEFRLIKTIGNDIVYVIFKNSFHTALDTAKLFYNDNPYSKEYDRIIIETTASNDVFYYGRIDIAGSLASYWEFCKNAEILSTSEGFFLWDQLFAVSKNGKNYAYIGLDQNRNNRTLYLNGNLYYSIDNYYNRAGLVQPKFSPNEENIAFLEIIETTEGRIYNFYVNKRKFGPYRSISGPSFSFSDDSNMLEIIIWRNTSTYERLEFRIN